MTDEELTRRLKENATVCPGCGSNVESFDMEPEDGHTIAVRVQCGGCGADWVELYRFEQAKEFTEYRV